MCREALWRAPAHTPTAKGMLPAVRKRRQGSRPVRAAGRGSSGGSHSLSSVVFRRCENSASCLRPDYPGQASNGPGRAGPAQARQPAACVPERDLTAKGALDFRCRVIYGGGGKPNIKPSGIPSDARFPRHIGMRFPCLPTTLPLLGKPVFVKLGRYRKELECRIKRRFWEEN